MIETVPETGSTNGDLLARLAAGESILEGNWLLAKRQTSGRGRSGRQWISTGPNLHVSTVVNLRPDDPPPQTLSLIIGMAVHSLVSGALLSVRQHEVLLKWPNDVLVDGAKVAGILLERSGDTIVVGIGINLHSAPDIPGRKTTFLHWLNSKYEASQEKALSVLAPLVARELQLWRSETPADVQRRWLANAHPVGASLSVHDGDGKSIKGKFAGLALDGALRLRLPDDAVTVIHAGDIMLEDG